MALQIATTLAAGVAAAAYLDARFLISNDLSNDSPSERRKKGLQFVTERVRQDKLLIYDILEDHANGPFANNTFLIFEGREWTYRQFYLDVERVGNWLISLGIQANEIVALDGTNTPEFLMLWLGLDAIAATPAFINFNLTAGALVHSVKISDARFLLADSLIQHLVQPHEEELLTTSNVKTIYYDQQRFDALPDATRTPTPASRRRNRKPDELTCLIYTSGTTGLPKAVMIPRARELSLAKLTSELLKLKPGQRVYTCLPLYHGSAHGAFLTPALYAGATVILGRKFSHKTFWPEIRNNRATIIQYVGELCRYLVNAPPDPEGRDKDHCVQQAWGNGMRPDVWEPFRQRFNIPVIHEFFGATDGLSNSYNYNRGPFGRSAIGVRGLYWQLTNRNERRILVDPDTQEIIRDARGFAIEAKTGEAGETVTKIEGSTSFTGYYKNQAATDKRMTSSLFKEGDLWFRSGDLMRLDPNGALYFVDRLGDTFRWKSENVSTIEVDNVLGKFDQIAEATVYGVLVPNADGRAGCAAIVPTGEIDFHQLAKHNITNLPRYAVPIFLRLVKEIEYTGTYKIQKSKLQKEGLDLDAIAQGPQKNDRLFWLPPNTDRYVPFERKAWQDLKAGRVKL